MESPMSGCYDHPQYYHLSYSHDMGEEIRFIRKLLARYIDSPTAKILEPACGTGRVLLPLLESGYRCTGFDNNHKAIRYLKKRLQRKGIKANVFNADMAEFSITGSPFDGAVCTVDTFRHLVNESEAVSHLQCVARQLRKDGVYLLAMHLLPSDGYTQQISRWRDRKGSLNLHTTISVLDVNRKKRLETLSIVFNVQTAGSEKKYRYVYKLRTYTLRQLKSMLNRIPAFEIAAVYNYYSFDSASPIRLNFYSEDVLLVLRKRTSS